MPSPFEMLMGALGGRDALLKSIGDWGQEQIVAYLGGAIPAIRAKIVDTIAGDCPPSLRAQFAAAGWNISDDEAGVIWRCVFRALCEAPAAETPPAEQVATSGG